MQNNKLILWPILAAIVIGFITGWFIKPAGSSAGFQTIKIHDTLKTSTTTYKIIPVVNYNIDSLTNSINQFWKDSLKTLYGKGLFEAKYSKEDELGKREYALESRIPLDPESKLIIDETFVFPKKTFSLVAGIGYSASFGLKYYVLDKKNVSLSGFVMEGYVFNDKCWKPNIGLECEYKF
jgi:hypothetical protein